MMRPGLHDRDPRLGVALARTHARLGRLLRDRLVGEHGDPDLAAALDVAGHRDTSGLDLAVGEPTGLERLDPVVAERDPRAALGGSGHAAALHLAVADLARHQHRDQSSSPEWNLPGSWCSRRAALDLFFLGEEALELGVGFVHDRRHDLVGLAAVGRDRLGRRTPATAAGAHDAPAGALARGLADRHGGFLRDLVGGGRLVGQDLALVDPDLHADAAERGARFGEAVVDVGAQRVQRHPTLAVALAAAHLRATEAAAALHLDAQRAGLHRRLQRALHRPAERHASRELVGDTLRDQRRVELGLLDLLDVEVDARVARDLEQARRAGARPPRRAGR